MQDRLHLPVGTPIQIQQEGVDNAPRFNVRLLGYYPGKGLIVTNTEFNGKTVLLTDDSKIVARAVQGNIATAFRVSVVQTSLTPYPHLHLTYPEEDAIEVSIVRDARRIDTKQPSLVRNAKEGSQYIEALIVDLSASGARIATRVPIGILDETVELKMEVEVGDESEPLVVTAVIKNVDFKKKGKLALHYYGLMFKGVNRFQRIVLHAYVLEETFKVKI
jgi:hypothetical protein